MSSEKNMDDYYSKVNEKSYAEGQVYDYENQNSILNEQIERLKTAKTKIQTEKSTFATIKKSTNKVVDKGYEWKGDTYDTFSNDGDTLVDDCKSYHDSIDDVIDDINYKIRDLNNQIYENEGLIGWFKARINDLWTEIDNFFN